MNRDEIEGKATELKGKVKQAAAHITDDPALHDEGTVDETAGKVQGAIGTARRKVGEAVEHVGKTLKK